MTALHRVRVLDDGRTEKYFPDENSDGLFELGDPARGKEHHHQKNAIFVRDLDMAKYLMREYGFALRMRGEITNQRNLISASEVEGL